MVFSINVASLSQLSVTLLPDCLLTFSGVQQRPLPVLAVEQDRRTRVPSDKAGSSSIKWQRMAMSCGYQYLASHGQ